MNPTLMNPRVHIAAALKRLAIADVLHHEIVVDHVHVTETNVMIVMVHVGADVIEVAPDREIAIGRVDGLADVQEARIVLMTEIEIAVPIVVETLVEAICLAESEKMEMNLTKPAQIYMLTNIMRKYPM